MWLLWLFMTVQLTTPKLSGSTIILLFCMILCIRIQVWLSKESWAPLPIMYTKAIKSKRALCLPCPAPQLGWLRWLKASRNGLPRTLHWGLQASLSAGLFSSLCDTKPPSVHVVSLCSLSSKVAGLLHASLVLPSTQKWKPFLTFRPDTGTESLLLHSLG